MSDPVAEKSGFLKAYMSNHPDTLVAYAKWFGRVQEALQSAEMSAIDTKSMTLNCTLKTGDKKEVRIEINPPLRDYNDVKPRLLEMKAVAQEGLGMIKAPRIETFQMPINRTVVITFIFMCGITYLRLAPQTPSLLWVPAQKALTYPYVAGLAKTVFNFTFASHILEAIYTFSLCYRHSTPLIPTVEYVVSTLWFGFNMWTDLRKRVQGARIDSVMKVE